MMKLISLDDYNLIPINKSWFKGKIYVDKRARIVSWQLAILEKYISQVLFKTSRAKKIDFDFHIVVTGDSEGIEFSVDVIAFADDITIDSQNAFNNAFSAVHWALNDIFSTIAQIFVGTIDVIPAELLKSYDSEQLVDSPLVEELPPPKKETVN